VLLLACPQLIVNGAAYTAVDAAKNDENKEFYSLPYGAESISTLPNVADGSFDGTVRKGQSDSRQRHRPVGYADECDGLEDPPCARTIGSASHLAPGLPRRVGDRLQNQASGVAVLHGSQSKRDLHVFKELLPLLLWKTNGQPSQARQQSISVSRLQTHSR
jgi:hypothetical protein